MERTTQGMKLETCADPSINSPVWQKLYGLQTVPALDPKRKQIDVKNFDDTADHYILGDPEYGALEYAFWFNREDTRDGASATTLKESYEALKTIAESTSHQSHFRHTYPDGESFQFLANVEVVRGGQGVGEALKFTLRLLLAGSITRTAATLGDTQ